MAKKVFLSPSDHGAGKNGCLHGGCYEDKHTRPIAEVCAKHLQRCGVEVQIGTANQSLQARCKDSNAFSPDLHVPIHTNAFNDPDTRYLMFMFYADDAKHRGIFNSVAPELEAVYPGKKDSVFSVRKDLVEINSTTATALYCELGFHTNKTDCDQFIHAPEMVGEALAKGICKALGVAYKAEPAGAMYRVNVDGTQKGAFRNVEYALNMARDFLTAGHDVQITVREQ